MTKNGNYDRKNDKTVGINQLSRCQIGLWEGSMSTLDVILSKIDP